MNKNLQIGGILSALAAGILLGGNVQAHEAGQANAGYVGDQNGHYITDSVGDCVRTGAWAQELMTVDCGAAPPVEAKAPPPPPPPAPPPAQPVYQTMTLTAGALFDVNKSTLKPAGKEELDAVAAKISGNAKVTDVKIVGHTDSTGTEAYNQQLSLKRATAVRDYLVSKGIDSNLMSVSGMGESQPIADNSTSAGRAKNRRVEVSIGVSEQK
jgi:OOP family OmpA-OmpF porin